MRQLILKVHISLDGYVAGGKGELDGFPGGEENLQFVCDLTKDADAALMGRISYEMLNSFWPGAKDLPGATKGEIEYSNWYNDVQKIVASTTLKDTGTNKTWIIGADLANEVRDIKQEPGKNIIIFGSPTVTHTLIQENLIDTYWVFINPVIFGKGVPLFRGQEKMLKLKLVDKKEFANGEVALQYEKTA